MEIIIISNTIRGKNSGIVCSDYIYMIFIYELLHYHIQSHTIPIIIIIIMSSSSSSNIMIINNSITIGIDTNTEVIVVSLTTWEAHHSARA